MKAGPDQTERHTKEVTRCLFRQSSPLKFHSVHNFYVRMLKNAQNHGIRRINRNDIVEVAEPFLASRTKEPFMIKTLQQMRQFLRDESGQDLIEYALVAALIALGAIAAMNNVATGISNAFSAVSSSLTSAVA